MTSFLNRAFAYLLGSIIALTFFAWLALGLLAAYKTAALFIDIVCGSF